MTLEEIVAEINRLFATGDLYEAHDAMKSIGMHACELAAILEESLTPEEWA